MNIFQNFDLTTCSFLTKLASLQSKNPCNEWCVKFEHGHIWMKLDFQFSNTALKKFLTQFCQIKIHAEKQNLQRCKVQFGQDLELFCKILSSSRTFAAQKEFPSFLSAISICFANVSAHHYGKISQINFYTNS